jgi:hypothetical protein
VESYSTGAATAAGPDAVARPTMKSSEQRMLGSLGWLPRPWILEMLHATY